MTILPSSLSASSWFRSCRGSSSSGARSACRERGFSDAICQLRGKPGVAGWGELEQAFFLGLGNGERTDELVQGVAGDAFFAAGERLQLLVGVFDSVAFHDCLDRFRKHVPIGFQVGAVAFRVRLEPVQTPETSVIGEQAVTERNTEVAPRRRVRE